MAQNYDAEIVGYIEATNDYQLEIHNDMTIDELKELIQKISRNSIVEYVSLHTAFQIGDAYITDDPINNMAGSLMDTNWNIKAINASKAWDFFDEMEIVKIGLTDGEFYKDHDDIDFYKAWFNSNNITYEHGTRVAGIMAAGFDNEIKCILKT